MELTSNVKNIKITVTKKILTLSLKFHQKFTFNGIRSHKHVVLLIFGTILLGLF